VVATQDFEIITIHADLPIEEQNKIFQESDKRKVIIATNIAETSLTVPGIVYVVDSGLIKSMDFDPRTGINSLVTKPHAKKGLEQRRGRAGRIEPGVYFGLYTQKSFYQRPEFPTAEILRSSLSQIVLVMIMLGIKEIESFKFIDMPDNHLIQVALNQLIKLGAIDSDRNITEKGIKMASLPMEPILANFILEAEKNQCVSTICSIAAFLEMKPVFINQNQEEILKNLIEERLNEKNGGEDQIEDLEESEMQELVRKAYDIYNDMLNRHRNLQHKGSDFLTLKKVLDLWEEQDDKEEWARKNYLNYESLVEASSIKQELLDICVQNKINVRDDISSRLIKKVDKTIIQAFKFNILSRMKNGFYRNIASKEKNIRIHNSSVVREEKPKFLVAFEIIEISEIDAPPKLSSKFLHEINDELMQRFFPEVYRYEMEFEKRRNRERFNKNNGHKFRLRKGHVGRRGKNPRKRR
jgi:HrpA-like RNA helicase